MEYLWRRCTKSCRHWCHLLGGRRLHSYGNLGGLSCYFCLDRPDHQMRVVRNLLVLSLWRSSIWLRCRNCQRKHPYWRQGVKNSPHTQRGWGTRKDDCLERDAKSFVLSKEWTRHKALNSHAERIICRLISHGTVGGRTWTLLNIKWRPWVERLRDQLEEFQKFPCLNESWGGLCQVLFVKPGSPCGITIALEATKLRRQYPDPNVKKLRT